MYTTESTLAHKRELVGYDGRLKPQTQYPNNAGDTVHCRICVVYAHDRVAD